ncbi:hypothetical protein SLA2020_248230 [Shorea laevis]
MLARSGLISCNFSYPPLKSSRLRISPKVRNFYHISSIPNCGISKFSVSLKPQNDKGGILQICRSSLNTQKPEENPDVDKGSSVFESNGKEGKNWTTSILLFGLWGALMYYVFNLTPNQTPSRDMYFLQKLLNLKGDDGYRMNDVLVSLWYIMGLWPLVYSMLMLPTARSSESKIPVWPFVSLSFFGGAYALLPYFVLWRPPPPPVEEDELKRWPLNFLESKITAGVSLVAGLGLIIYAALANGDDWKEFYQYFRESKFIHITCLDFTLLSTFAPFWVYNDMTARKWYDKGSSLLPLSLVPFLGPALYLVLRPSLSELPVSAGSTSKQK